MSPTYENKKKKKKRKEKKREKEKKIYELIQSKSQARSEGNLMLSGSH